MTPGETRQPRLAMKEQNSAKFNKDYITMEASNESGNDQTHLSLITTREEK